MLSRFLDWLDEAAGGLIRLAYLLAGITAVAVYFGAGHLPPVIADALDSALPWALAFAIETHTYVTARRVRSAWQDMQAATHGQPEWERARAALRVNLGILAGLLAFSCWNQLNFLYATWTPPTTALQLPGWTAYVVRALIVPGAFMAAAFLAPLALPIAAQVETEARATLADVFKIARRQRRRMLRQAEQDGRDMTGALVELVEDPAARRIISHAYGAIRPRQDAALALPAPDEVYALQPPFTATMPAPTTPPPSRPPTGPGTPVSAPVAPPEPPQEEGVRTPPKRQRNYAIRLVDPDAPVRRRRSASGAARRGVRTPAAIEQAARAAWANGARTITEIRTAAGISKTAAATQRRILAAEAAAQPQETGQRAQ